jgi:hypothetical protein
MDQMRRNILLGAGGALGGAALTGSASLAAPARQLVLLSTYVAGTAYHDAGEAASALRPGDPIALHREHRSDYDPRAVEVRTRSGAKLGYLPRVDNHAIANLMDAGFEVTARVDEVVPDARQPDIRLAVLASL